jgi:hypothetical protein
LSNQLAIAVGSEAGDASVAIPQLALWLTSKYGVPFSADTPDQYFAKWNSLVELCESRVSRAQLVGEVNTRVAAGTPTAVHRAVASIPVSNFIDTTFSRQLYKALLELSREPICHDWRIQMIGVWRQSNPERPNVFFSLPPTDGAPTMYGVSEPLARHPQNMIQLENVREMLRGRDLLLVGVSPYEAEYLLHLGELCLAFDKCYVDGERRQEVAYWATRGVMLCDVPMAEILGALTPAQGQAYSRMDGLSPRMALIDIGRQRQYDAFLSYFSGDRDFATRLEGDLHLRGLRIWRDEREIAVGDSMTDKIQRGIADSFTFLIVLSPEALARPWVNEELRAAYALRLASGFRILPIVHRDCELPPFLADYKYADFRDHRRYAEQLSLVERAIQNAVADARGKR